MRVLSGALEIAGLCLITAGAFLISPALGLLAAGTACVLVGVALPEART